MWERQSVLRPFFVLSKVLRCFMENEKDPESKWSQWSPTLEETNAIDRSSVCVFYFLFCWEAAVSRGAKLPPLVLPDVRQRRSQQAETKSLKYILLPYINTVAVTLLCSPLFIISAPLERWHPMAFTSTKNNLYWSLLYSYSLRLSTSEEDLECCLETWSTRTSHAIRIESAFSKCCVQTNSALYWGSISLLMGTPHLQNYSKILTQFGRTEDWGYISMKIFTFLLIGLNSQIILWNWNRFIFFHFYGMRLITQKWVHVVSYIPYHYF